MTKKQQRMAFLYRFAKYTDIYEAYVKPSASKVAKFRNIMCEMKMAGGHSLRITGAGATFFSCAYVIDKDMPMLVYHTADNVYKFPLT